MIDGLNMKWVCYKCNNGIGTLSEFPFQPLALHLPQILAVVCLGNKTQHRQVDCLPRLFLTQVLGQRLPDLEVHVVLYLKLE